MHFVNGAQGRRVECLGGVMLRGVDGTVRALEATGTMRAGGGAMGGLERVVFRGEVRVEQPGRVATGEELVWTAADRTFLLTGTASAPPVVTDAVRGRVSGGAIRFRPQDNSVVVTGAGSGRVHTETRLQER